MAENERQENVLQTEDLMAVRSRISWAAIFAGAVMSLAVYLILTLLGGAIGLSVSDNVRSENLATGAAVWAVATTILALFVGGWVTSQVAVGENRVEAMVHGIVMWGVVLAIFMWMVATGVRAGFSAMFGMANFVQGETQWENLARRAGVPDAEINRARSAIPSDFNANREQTQDAAASASWWILFGTLLSMVSAIGGALLGAGPSLRLLVVQPGVRGVGAGIGSRPAVR